MAGWLRGNAPTITIWLASRVSVFVAAVYSTWILAGNTETFTSFPAQEIPSRGPVYAWQQWDVVWYASIATNGYGAEGFESNYAFMPGLPGLMWAFGKLPLVNLHPTMAGLVISIVAGLVAAVALSVLTRDAGGRAEFGPLAWVLAPMAVFLAAPYTEALFCAFAFTAWVCMRRGQWMAAALLAAGATLVRVNGLFLAAALIVAFLMTRERRWIQAPLLLLPFAAFAGVMAFYSWRTGTWTAWLDAQYAGWGREFTLPWDSWRTTVDLAFNKRLTATYAVQYRMELAAMVIMVVFAIVLAVRRWWAEATYVLLTTIALGTSTNYYSIPRTLLALFPIWILFGLWMSRYRSVLVTYVAVSTPLMLIGVMAFTNGRWIA